MNQLIEVRWNNATAEDGTARLLQVLFVGAETRMHTDAIAARYRYSQQGYRFLQYIIQLSQSYLGG
jgi:hypothetical protein